MPVAPAPDKMKLHKWSGTKAETEIRPVMLMQADKVSK
jgi:hypothetical protein